jgi:hypothetical protein
VKITSSLPLYFDFPLNIGKKWKRRFSGRPSFATRDYDFLIEYKVVSYESIKVVAGTFKAFKIEITHTNYDARMASGKAYIWYSPEIKAVSKVTFETVTYWRGAPDYELIWFNLKDKQSSAQEIKSIPQKVEIPPGSEASKSEALPPRREELPNMPKEKPQAITSPELSTETTIVIVTGTYANIRSGAGNEFPIVATVNQNDKLTLLGEYGDWYSVKLGNGQEGWINNRFVK